MTDNLQNQIIEIVRKEKNNWEDATAFITEKVAFQMRNLIRLLRKNYWGIFDNEYDPTTGRKKIWIPLTESLTESVVKNIDLDTKDINFRSKHSNAQGLTQVIKAIVKNFLDAIGFGEYLDDLERRIAIDGTAVWKTLKVDGELKIIPVDLLNVYIDPTAESIQKAYRFTERSLLTQDEVKSMNWMNKNVEPTQGLAPTDSGIANTASQTTSKYVDVWELWGKVPQSLFTGKSKDTDEVDGHIIVSGLDSPGKEKVHLLEKYDGLKPYEECWYTRVPGRWYGKGVAEKLLMLQLWINTVVNIRINRAYVSQLGIFKIRKGSGVTPQMLSKLAANGAVVLNNMEDLEQLAMEEASQASYKDEDVIMNWARQTTAAFEVVTGEQLPASTSATATALQSKSASSQFVLIQEGIGLFLQRWLKNQAIPKITKTVKVGDLVRMGFDAEDLLAYDERIVNEELAIQLNKMNQAGLFVNPEQVLLEKQRAITQLQNSGLDRFVKLMKSIKFTDYDVYVDITNESFDKSITLQNLLQMFQVIPALPPGTIDPVSLARQIVDVMGLDGFRIKAGIPLPQAQNQVNSTGAATQPGGNSPVLGKAQNLVEQVAGATTMEPA